MFYGSNIKIFIPILCRKKTLSVCYSGVYDQDCRINNTGESTDLTFYLKKCQSIGDICTMTGFKPYDGKYCLDGSEQIPWYTNVTRTLAAEEYYK